jgi:glutamine synthetase
VTENPVGVAEAQGIAQLPQALAPALEALAASSAAARVLGPDIVAAVLAVRRWELDHYGDVPADELPEKFRFAWSI